MRSTPERPGEGLNVLDPTDPRPAVRAALVDWLVYQRAHALRPQAAVAALAGHGDPARALHAVPPTRAKVATEPERRRPDQQHPDGPADLAALLRAGAVAVPVTSSAYPARLAALSDAAPLLLVRGNPEVLSGRCISIVGSRAATVYGRRVARQWAAELASAGVVIVSGLARGIDAEAHLGALDAGGTTVAILACGIDRVYPREHRSLAERIAERGAVVAELPMGTHPLPPFFPMRNRLISGLSSGLLVVEARLRSGSLTTAAHAANQGRDVFAVPGPVNAPTSEGPNRLLRDGAAAALCAGDLLFDLGWERVVPRSSARAGDAKRPQSARAASILAALAQAPASRDELADALHCTPGELSVDVLELELAGRIAEDRDGRLRIVDLPE